MVVSGGQSARQDAAERVHIPYRMD